MTTQHTDQDTIREQVQARYAAAAIKVTSGPGDCGCGQPADCGCESGCCGAATAEEPGFGAELYAALDRDALPDKAVLASLGCGNPTAVAELHEGETVLDPSRVAAQVVSGIGFIGGGLIFVRDAVRGLTTAAGVWLTAGVGMAAGAGLGVLATAGTLIYLFVAYAFPVITQRLPRSRGRPVSLRVT